MKKTTKTGHGINVREIAGLLGAETHAKLQVVSLGEYLRALLDTGAIGSLETFLVGHPRAASAVAMAVIRLPISAEDLAELLTHLCKAIAAQGMITGQEEASPLPFQEN